MSNCDHPSPAVPGRMGGAQVSSPNWRPLPFPHCRGQPAQEKTMHFELTNTTITAGLLLLFLLAAVTVGMYLKHRKNRTRDLRKRFGSEYDRAVATHGSTKNAELKLTARENRVKAFELRELGVTERGRFVADWQAVQSR